MAKFSILQSFYASDRWRDFRLNLIAERGNKCSKCGNTIPRPIDIIGHHKVELTPENVMDYNISLNPEMIDLICHDCHSEEHDRFGYQKKKEVYLVYGPPLAGKKTFVLQQKKQGDLIVNIDLLYSAVTMLPEFDKPDNLFSNVIGIHNLLVDNIQTRMGKWKNAWVIGGYADKFKRERLADDLGAELIFMDIGREECYARLETDERLLYRRNEYRHYIDDWFDKYRE